MVIFGEHAQNTLDQFIDVASRAKYAALLADGHLGYGLPIGGVAAYDNQISVIGVGFDIACGNCAIKTNLKLEDLTDLNELADEIASTISFGIGRNNKANDAPTDHSLFESDAWSIIPAKHRDDLRSKARKQLGTVGSGNHYVDVFYDETNSIWVGVHFGSRGLGHTIASSFLALSQNLEWGQHAPEKEVLLDLDQPLGQSYASLMTLAGDYAHAGRDWVTRKVVSLLGGQEMDYIHNHHNYAWLERHYGQDLIVIRKGATPAFPGQRGFVGGSMGDSAVILHGTDLEDNSIQRAALFSTVHGAGRVMSRNEARGKIKRGKSWACGNRNCDIALDLKDAKRGPNGELPPCPTCGSKMHKRNLNQIISTGKVSSEMMTDWLDREGVILRGGGLDESPHAYRRLPDVLKAQGATIEIEHTLRPLIVVMAGANEFDPYKD